MDVKVSIITPVRAKAPADVQWLSECIASVRGQTAAGWEHIVVNDHSPQSLRAVQAAWPHVRWLEAEHQNVSAARNQAAEAATGELLLPLDADDKLAASAIAQFLAAWGGEGILYSDVVMFGEDYARVYTAAEYDFRTLLAATFMTVGCLHRKADWERVGGWRLDMAMGLEDWEYWIALGELGVCGKRVPEPLYWYRRHPRGRLQWLKANQNKWDRAYQAMRSLHVDSYNGRYPMGCCGGRRRAATPRPPVRPGVPEASVRADGTVQLLYVGTRRGSFELVGPTRTRYLVGGTGWLVETLETGKQGVRREDVTWFRSINQGRDFKLIEQPAAPKPAAPPVAAPAPVAPVTAVESHAWDAAVMEDVAALAPEMPDISELTVRDIKAEALTPEEAAVWLKQELDGKARKTVLEHLEALAGG